MMPLRSSESLLHSDRRDYVGHTALIAVGVATQGQIDRAWSGKWIAFVWSSVPGVLVATAAAAGLVPESLALALFAISFVGLNLMHMGATWARVYVRPGWRVNPFERLALPVSL